MTFIMLSKLDKWKVHKILNKTVKTSSFYLSIPNPNPNPGVNQPGAKTANGRKSHNSMLQSAAGIVCPRPVLFLVDNMGQKYAHTAPSKGRHWPVRLEKDSVIA